MLVPRPHAYDCRCATCRDMAKAIAAQNPDGSYAFTDAELEQLVMQRAAAEDDLIEEGEEL